MGKKDSHFLSTSWWIRSRRKIKISGEDLGILTGLIRDTNRESDVGSTRVMDQSVQVCSWEHITAGDLTIARIKWVSSTGTMG